MATINQVARRARRRTQGYNRSPLMNGRPQRAGVCVKVGTTSPKKPNSAVRKIAKVALRGGRTIRAVIPGSGFEIGQHSRVIFQAGRVRDLPGVHYRLVRGRADFGAPSGFERHNRRSKFGTPNWLYVVRNRDDDVTHVISRSRRRRQASQEQMGLDPTWGRSPVYQLSSPIYAVTVASGLPLEKPTPTDTQEG